MSYLNNIFYKNKADNFFSRYEIKYVLNKKISRIIKDQVKLFMNYDGYINKDEGENYFCEISIF